MASKGAKTPHSLIAAFKSTRSFRIHDEPETISGASGRSVDGPAQPDASRDRDNLNASCSSKPSHSEPETRLNFAGVDVDCLNDSSSSDGAINNASAKLADIYARTGVEGIAIRCTDIQSLDRLNNLLEMLCLQTIPVLLIASHDWGLWSSANISLTAGVIVENACILPNGKRRDYFRSRPLRELMARCSKERETRPEFLIGFLDLWEQRPHPSVVRRGVKLAEHFGAIIEHGPSRTTGDVLPSAVKDASQTLSGFEYLRRGPVIEVSLSFYLRKQH